MKTWHDSKPFNAVILKLYDGFIPTVALKLPKRDNVDSCRADLLCFWHKCDCVKKPRVDGHACLRLLRTAPGTNYSYVDYIDNANGFRAKPTKI